MRMRSAVLGLVLAGTAAVGCDRDVASPPMRELETVTAESQLLGRWQVARATEQRQPTIEWAVVGSNGGTIRIGDNTLEVLPGAVLEPTRFRMEIRGGDYMVVDLNAYRLDGTPVLLFAKPNSIRLSLSYSDAVLSAGSSVAIVYLPDGSPSGLAVGLSSNSDPSQKIVRTTLSHFSTYAIAFD